MQAETNRVEHHGGKMMRVFRPKEVPPDFSLLFLSWLTNYFLTKQKIIMKKIHFKSHLDLADPKYNLLKGIHVIKKTDKENVYENCSMEEKSRLLKVFVTPDSEGFMAEFIELQSNVKIQYIDTTELEMDSLFQKQIFISKITERFRFKVTELDGYVAYVAKRCGVYDKIDIVSIEEFNLIEENRIPLFLCNGTRALLNYLGLPSGFISTLDKSDRKVGYMSSIYYFVTRFNISIFEFKKEEKFFPGEYLYTIPHTLFNEL